MNLFISFLKNKLTCNKTYSDKIFKIHPLEIKFDKDTNGPFVFITPIYKFKPHKYFIEDLIDNEIILKQLEDKSIKYIFYAYGMLRATEKNNFYILEEFLFLNKLIKVKNMQTLKYEEWDKNNFEQYYNLLDKSSLKKATEFFHSISKKECSQLENNLSEPSSLKLIK